MSAPNFKTQRDFDMYASDMQYVPEMPETITLSKSELLKDYDETAFDFEDMLSEYITDYGLCCHTGFNYTIEGDTITITDIEWDLSDEDLFDEDTYENAQFFIDHELNDKLEYFKITLEGGYYFGIQTIVDQAKENYRFDVFYYMTHEDEYSNSEIYEIFGFNKYILNRVLNKEIKLINEKLLPQLKDYGFERYACVGIFSNGEAIYERV